MRKLLFILSFVCPLLCVVSPVRAVVYTHTVVVAEQKPPKGKPSVFKKLHSLVQKKVNEDWKLQNIWYNYLMFAGLGLLLTGIAATILLGPWGLIPLLAGMLVGSLGGWAAIFDRQRANKLTRLMAVTTLLLMAVSFLLTVFYVTFFAVLLLVLLLLLLSGG